MDTNKNRSLTGSMQTERNSTTDEHRWTRMEPGILEPNDGLASRTHLRPGSTPSVVSTSAIGLNRAGRARAAGWPWGLGPLLNRSFLQRCRSYGAGFDPQRTKFLSVFQRQWGNALGNAGKRIHQPCQGGTTRHDAAPDGGGLGHAILPRGRAYGAGRHVGARPIGAIPTG
jgi:hypothetical protein